MSSSLDSDPYKADFLLRVYLGHDGSGDPKGGISALIPVILIHQTPGPNAHLFCHHLFDGFLLLASPATLLNETVYLQSHRITKSDSGR
jgi:hypothetical protein